MVERLEDDGRARLELGEDTVDVDRPAERLGLPGKVGRVGARIDRVTVADEPEGRETKRARADQPLDVVGRDQILEAIRLLPAYDERLLLPVSGEEFFRVDRLD